MLKLNRGLLFIVLVVERASGLRAGSYGRPSETALSFFCTILVRMAKKASAGGAQVHFLQCELPLAFACAQNAVEQVSRFCRIVEHEPCQALPARRERLRGNDA